MKLKSIDKYLNRNIKIASNMNDEDGLITGIINITQTDILSEEQEYNIINKNYKNFDKYVVSLHRHGGSTYKLLKASDLIRGFDTGAACIIHINNKITKRNYHVIHESIKLHIEGFNEWMNNEDWEDDLEHMRDLFYRDLERVGE